MIVLESIFGDFFQKKAKCFLKEKGANLLSKRKRGSPPRERKRIKSSPEETVFFSEEKNRAFSTDRKAIFSERKKLQELPKKNEKIAMPKTKSARFSF